MGRFTSEDKMLLYIVRTTAEEVGGSWNDCTKTYNSLASCTRTQDELTAAYRALNKEELRSKALDTAWKKKTSKQGRVLDSGKKAASLRHSSSQRPIRGGYSV